jgi:hypothetical protein
MKYYWDVSRANWSKITDVSGTMYIPIFRVWYDTGFRPSHLYFSLRPVIGTETRSRDFASFTRNKSFRIYTIINIIVTIIIYRDNLRVYVAIRYSAWMWSKFRPFKFQVTLLIRLVEDGVQLGPLGTAAANRPIVPAPGDYEDGEIGGMMIGRGNRSTRKKSALVALCTVLFQEQTIRCRSLGFVVQGNRRKPFQHVTARSRARTSLCGPEAQRCNPATVLHIIGRDAPPHFPWPELIRLEESLRGEACTVSITVPSWTLVPFSAS